jgi:hypothetical protein
MAARTNVFFPLLLGMIIRVQILDICQVPDLIGMDMGIIFYQWVASVPDPNRDGYETGIFSHPQVT